MDHPHRPVEAHMCSRKGRIASLKAHGRFTELVLMSRIHDKRDENTLDNTRTLLGQTWEFVQSLEPMLRETSGKSRDEWDLWMGRMVGDLMGGDGAGCGECLEVGAWWARKK
ncbi:hypothetical protein VdG1_03538 [Verticillium dahliae VDG1]|nr:hypothetical protein VdG1_03538 [Verticillium dahliae VDG1]